MIEGTFSLRRVATAYLFQRMLDLTRDLNVRFMDRVQEQGIDVTQLTQQPASLRLSRESGGKPPSTFEILVDHHQGKFRLLIVEEWPTKHHNVFQENADVIWEAFQEIWPLERLGPAVLVETGLRLGAVAEGESAAKYLLDQCCRVPHEALSKLGREVQSFGLRLVLPVQISATADTEIPLPAATASIRIESMIDDPSQLYFEMVTKWPLLPLPPQVQKVVGSSLLNEKPLKPSHYVVESYNYLTSRVADFLRSAQSK